MNWGEFKLAVEEKGVKDDTAIAWIDYDGSRHIKIEIEHSHNSAIAITEDWFPDLDELCEVKSNAS